MSKIAKYLNEHILGEVDYRTGTLSAFSNDASVLSIKPDMVVSPRNTSDIRKVARFTWQLADKGHILPIVSRGAGSDQTGAAIGKGIILNTTSHMTDILELDIKQKLVRVQPGITYKSLNDALSLHGLTIPSYPASHHYSTVGGAIANNAGGMLSGRYGRTDAWVRQLEVVLASGDVLQTGRISRREVSRIKGLQNYVGEVYRKIDGLIDDNKELIDEKISGQEDGAAGYPGIAKVKNKDGSIDLTPLILGSQGTLGVISEVIMRSDYISPNSSSLVAIFSGFDAAQDSLDEIAALKPSSLHIYDGELFMQATAEGKKYKFNSELAETGAVVVMQVDDFSDRNRAKRLKKAARLLEKRGAQVLNDPDDEDAYRAIDSVTSTVNVQSIGDTLGLFDGVYIPSNRLDGFKQAVELLSKRFSTPLPLYARVLESSIYCRPVFHLHKVTDRQRAIKLLEEFSDAVYEHDGYLCNNSAEGRLLANYSYQHIDAGVLKLYEQIRKIFDPNNSLNPGVKQSIEKKELAKLVRSDYSTPKLAGQSLKS
ncbi:MAG: FAD-binding oxidoreductase [bacterium]|nr:FAD-binding oxidoreductase [bacterium]MDN5835078.1 FAD-binding oxidoreductase [bacterium]